MLKQQPLAVREAVEEVCVDMWGGFPKVIKEVFPQAKIVIDRFHVQKLVNKDLNKIRLNLKLKGLNNKYLLTSNQANLTLAEKTELELLLQISPCLRIAHEVKEELVTIYNSKITSRRAMRTISKWLKSAKIIFSNAANTLDSHLSGICNYFNNRTTSGVVEGACNRSVFETWQTCLILSLKPGPLVIADNATFHKGGKIQAWRVTRHA